MNAPVRTLTLYQLADDYLAALDALTASDDFPPEAVAATLAGLAGSFEDKAVNVALYIRTLEAEAAALDEARKALERRATALTHHAERLRAYLKGEMERTGLVRLRPPFPVVRIQANPPGVVIEDERRVPKRFKERVVTVKLLKAEIARALKAGERIAGAHLEQTTRLVIQ